MPRQAPYREWFFAVRIPIDSLSLAGPLFWLVNEIAVEMIGEPKRITATYGTLPPTSLDQIAKRDRKAS